MNGLHVQGDLPELLSRCYRTCICVILQRDGHHSLRELCCVFGELVMDVRAFVLFVIRFHLQPGNAKFGFS